MKYIFFFSLILSIYPVVSFSNDLEDIKKRIDAIEEKESCRQQFKDAEISQRESKNKISNADILEEYVTCIDRLVNQKRKDEKYSRYSVQLLVTANDSKANDLVKAYNKSAKKNELLKNAKASYIPYDIPYPGGYKLNDGRYYKVIVGSYLTEDEAKEQVDKIKSVYKSRYQDAFVTQIFLY